MTFLLLNFLIIFAFYSLCAKWDLERFSYRLALTGLLWLSQIIITELLLGILGFLYPAMLAVVNAAISVAVLSYSLPGTDLRALLSQSIQQAGAGWKQVLTWENRILLGLGVFVGAWFGVAAYLLPLRGGGDDTFYHLAPVFEFVTKHRIYLLPLITIKDTFAFPHNADLLFAWPAIFFHDQRWLDLVQFIVALYAVIVVYALARTLGQSGRTAFFLATVFLMTPVVLHQAESNYSDIITNTFFLAALFCALQFRQTGRLPYLYGLAVAGGLLLGMKYFMVIFWACLLPFVLPRLIKGRANHIESYFSIVVLLCCYWYLRNWLELGNPFSPILLFQHNFGIFFTGQAGQELNQWFTELSLKFNLLFVTDIGLGKYHGGYGLFFWGIAFPSWILVFGRVLRGSSARGTAFPFWFWTLPLLAFGLLIFVPPIREMTWSGRWVIFLVPLCFLAVGELLTRYTLPGFFGTYVRIFGLMSSFLSVTLLSATVCPNYNFSAALADRLHGKSPSEFKYCRNSCWVLPQLSGVAELLDTLTRNERRGLDCYMAGADATFWVTILYGEHFQNRVWNFLPDPQSPPDVYVYQKFFGRKTVYVGKKISLAQIVADPEYLLIAQTPPHVKLFITKTALTQDGRAGTLCDYYQENFGRWIAAARLLTPSLDNKTPVLTSQDIGYGLRYLSLRREIGNRLFWVPVGAETFVIRENKLTRFYTIDRAVPGFAHRLTARLALTGGRELRLYENYR